MCQHRGAHGVVVAGFAVDLLPAVSVDGILPAHERGAVGNPVTQDVPPPAPGRISSSTSVAGTRRGESSKGVRGQRRHGSQQVGHRAPSRGHNGGQQERDETSIRGLRKGVGEFGVAAPSLSEYRSSGPPCPSTKSCPTTPLDTDKKAPFCLMKTLTPDLQKGKKSRLARRHEHGALCVGLLIGRKTIGSGGRLVVACDGFEGQRGFAQTTRSDQTSTSKTAQLAPSDAEFH